MVLRPARRVRKGVRLTCAEVAFAVLWHVLLEGYFPYLLPLRAQALQGCQAQPLLFELVPLFESLVPETTAARNRIA
jgi:hypothetical protein